MSEFIDFVLWFTPYYTAAAYLTIGDKGEVLRFIVKLIFKNSAESTVIAGISLTILVRSYSIDNK